jgi:hypothetical protein
MKLKKSGYLLACLLAGLLIAAKALPSTDPLPINQIALQLTAEQWVVTKTANVIVGVDATFNGSQLAQARTDILGKLAKFVPNSEWHITTFDRTQDDSGLEKIHLEAQARIPDQSLGDVRQQAKSFTKPGETYNIINIDYTPTVAEMEAVRNDLRAKIYSQIKDELARVNSVYTNQQYYVHSIDFAGFNAQPPQPMAGGRMMMAAVQANAEAQPAIAVSNKITMQVTAILAATIPGINNSDSISPAASTAKQYLKSGEISDKF